MKITPEEADRMARKAEGLEAEAEREGINVSVTAGRPPHLRVYELALEHERHQARLRLTTIVANGAAFAAIGLFAWTGMTLILVAAAVSLAGGLALQIVAGRSARSFKARVGVPTPVPRTRVPA